MPVISALLFGISANIDTFMLGFSYGIKKQHISLLTNFFLSTITLLGTLLSIVIGLHLSTLINPEIAQIAGSIFLILLGLYYCVKYLFTKHLGYPQQISSPAIAAASIPSAAPTDMPSTLSLSETILLGLTLTLNNAGMGIGASLAGTHVFLTLGITFFTSAFFLIAGNRLGTHFAAALSGPDTNLLSGLIIIILGLFFLVP